MASAATTTPLPSIYLAHGGGPCWFLEGGRFADMDKNSRGAQFLREKLPPRLQLERARAILIISAHWETREGHQVLCREDPGLLYDYYGFPPETYAPHLVWGAKSDPKLGREVVETLRAAGLTAGVEEGKRGFDHGVFVPLKVPYPDKPPVPVVQLSLAASLDPDHHLRLGAALAPLRKRGFVILGSGAATHNLGAIAAPGAKADRRMVAFHDWLQATMTSLGPQKSETREVDAAGAAAGGADAAAVKARRLAALARLGDWESAPHARFAHPREEHFIPLHVVVGAAFPAETMEYLAAKGAAAPAEEAAEAAEAPATARADHLFRGWAGGGLSLSTWLFDQ